MKNETSNIAEVYKGTEDIMYNLMQIWNSTFLDLSKHSTTNMSNPKTIKYIKSVKSQIYPQKKTQTGKFYVTV